MEGVRERPAREVLPATPSGKRQLAAEQGKWERFVKAIGLVMQPAGSRHVMTRLFRRLITLVRWRQQEHDLQDELTAHVAMDAQERIEAGEPPDLARQAARRDFGNVARVTEDTRAAWGWTGAEQVLQDLRYAFRQLRRTPGFSAVVVATLALGIGGATSVFSVLQAVLLAPCPTSSQVSSCASTSRSPTSPPHGPHLAGPHFGALRDHAASFESVAALANYRETGRDLVKDGPAQRLRVLRVTSDYFQTLRSGPLRGPGFDRSDEAGIRRVVLGHAIWRARFDADAAVIGSTIQLSGEPYEVVGIAPPASRIQSPATWTRGFPTAWRETPIRRTTR